jgi:hypothetical protein
MSDKQHAVRQLQPAVGSAVAIRLEDLIIDCKVIDAKNSYGRVRILIEPNCGRGQQWVELSRLVEVPANTLAKAYQSKES